jgi:hypothetical protein
MTYYPSPQKKLRIFISIGAFILVFFLMMLAFSSFFSSGSLIESLINFLLVLMISLIPLKAWSDLVNVYPDVWLTGDGLYISVNIFWKIKIEWDAIVQIKELPRKKGVLLLVPKITFFHRDFGEKGLHGVVLPARAYSPQLIEIIEQKVLSPSERITKVI